MERCAKSGVEVQISSVSGNLFERGKSNYRKWRGEEKFPDRPA